MALVQFQCSRTVTKIKSSKHLFKLWHVTKFGGRRSKNEAAMPLRSLKWFWQEIHFVWSKDFEILWRVEILWVLELVKIWCWWYLKALLKNPKSINFVVFECPHLGIEIIFKNYFIPRWGDWGSTELVIFELLKNALRYQHKIFTSSSTYKISSFCKI